MYKRLLLISGLVILGVYAASAHAQDGVGKRIGEQLDQAVGQLRDEAKEAAGQLQEGFDKARRSVHRMGVAARVYARLHWDKALTEATISVDVNPDAVKKDNVAALSGTVGSEAAKKRAEELAQSTVGVDRVVNDLKVVRAAEPR